MASVAYLSLRLSQGWSHFEIPTLQSSLTDLLRTVNASSTTITPSSAFQPPASLVIPPVNNMADQAAPKPLDGLTLREQEVFVIAITKCLKSGDIQVGPGAGSDAPQQTPPPLPQNPNLFFTAFIFHRALGIERSLLGMIVTSAAWGKPVGLRRLYNMDSAIFYIRLSSRIALAESSLDIILTTNHHRSTTPNLLQRPDLETRNLQVLSGAASRRRSSVMHQLRMAMLVTLQTKLPRLHLKQRIRRSLRRPKHQFQPTKRLERLPPR